MKGKTITVQNTVSVSPEKAWEFWNEPKHIVEWNSASDDWHSPSAENNLEAGGRFKIRMQAKDKSAGFDFEGTYSKVEKYKLIEYKIADGRQVKILFEKAGEGTKITEIFETENVYSEEQQRSGWQSILDNFKIYAESR